MRCRFVLRLADYVTSKRAVSLLSAVAIVAAACGAAPQAVAPSSSPAAVTETPKATPAPTATPKPLWPLTGLPASDGAAIHRRPLNVRIPSDVNARPQTGFAKADLVFEMIVEGGVTRYALIFHSQDSENVGPVRSYRYSDVPITRMLRGVIVSSGATVDEAAAATTSIKSGELLSVDDQRTPQPNPYFRVSTRTSPNNLYANLLLARKAASAIGGDKPVDVPPLRFLPSPDHDAAAGGFAGAVPASTLTIPFLREPTTYIWDSGANGYRRSQRDVRTVDPDGNTPVLARNVVLMWTNISTTTTVEDNLGSLGLDYVMTGGGKASIFRDGRRQDGTWKRDNPLDQFSFYNQSGEEIALSPGQSWISFVYPTWVVTSAP